MQILEKKPTHQSCVTTARKVLQSVDTIDTLHIASKVSTKNRNNKHQTFNSITWCLTFSFLVFSFLVRLLLYSTVVHIFNWITRENINDSPTNKITIQELFSCINKYISLLLLLDLDSLYLHSSLPISQPLALSLSLFSFYSFFLCALR